MPTNPPPRDRKAASGAKATPPTTRAGSGPGSAGRPASAGRPSTGKAPVAGKTPVAGAGRSARPAPAGRGRSGSRSSSRSTAGSPGSRPPKGRPKSIVSQKQRPWGLIAAAAAVVVFAALVIGFAVYKINQPRANPADANYVRAEIAAAKAIQGVKYKQEPDHNHVSKTVKYNTSPPTGGNHAQVWADCAGTVYPNPIADENAVHSLEHGAVWITYRPGLAAADVATLATLVTGQNGTVLSPYPGLTSAISLQAWDYQLFVDKANDPRIAAFLKALRMSPATTPEFGASCANAAFKKAPSTPGHPSFQ